MSSLGDLDRVADMLGSEGRSPNMLERILGSFPQVIQLLRNDHKMVRSLFKQYEKASKGQKPQLAHQIMQELTVHAAVEEQVVYPALRQAFKEPQSVVYEAVEEHHLAHLWLKELNSFRPGPGSATFDAKFNVLREVVKHHVNEEEGHLFPKAEAQNLDWTSLYEKALKIKNQRTTKSIACAHVRAQILVLRHRRIQTKI